MSGGCPAKGLRSVGIFDVTIGVGHPDGDGDLVEVLATVDTGAAHTILPTTLLQQLHVQPRKQGSIRYADGSIERRSVGQVRKGYAGEDWICSVVFGPEDVYLMGATTLENFGLIVDPMDQKLIPAEYVARPFQGAN